MNAAHANETTSPSSAIQGPPRCYSGQNQKLIDTSGREYQVSSDAQQSYVTDDKISCVYIAEDPEAIREHARLASLPVDAVHQIGSAIDPSTGADPVVGVGAGAGVCYGSGLVDRGSGSVGQ